MRRRRRRPSFDCSSRRASSKHFSCAVSSLICVQSAGMKKLGCAVAARAGRLRGSGRPGRRLREPNRRLPRRPELCRYSSRLGSLHCEPERLQLCRRSSALDEAGGVFRDWYVGLSPMAVLRAVGHEQPTVPVEKRGVDEGAGVVAAAAQSPSSNPAILRTIAWLTRIGAAILGTTTSRGG
jgi:hypothetical protein